jgi:maltodextrin utilization protein YvdJ
MQMLMMSQQTRNLLDRKVNTIQQQKTEKEKNNGRSSHYGSDYQNRDVVHTADQYFLLI